MPVFPVQILTNSTPALSITVADSGVPAVTYKQVKQSLGVQVYRIFELYLYSENMNQLLGVIQYQRFDADGNQKISSIATTIDPFAGNSVSTMIDLNNYNEDFILNGNSSFSTVILPNTYVQVKFWAERVTNEFGRNLQNFAQIEIDANKPDFFNNYGFSYQTILKANREIEKTATLDLKNVAESKFSDEDKLVVIEKESDKHLIFLGIAAIALGAYLSQRD